MINLSFHPALLREVCPESLQLGPHTPQWQRLLLSLMSREKEVLSQGGLCRALLSELLLSIT